MPPEDRTYIPQQAVIYLLGLASDLQDSVLPRAAQSRYTDNEAQAAFIAGAKWAIEKYCNLIIALSVEDDPNRAAPTRTDESEE